MSDNDIPEQESESEPITIVVLKCYLCDSVAIAGKCLHCNKYFCDKDTNKLDSRYCNECMTDITIEDTTYTKTSEEYDEDTDTIHFERKTCRDILFKGIDWMFVQRRLSDMSDAEAKTELEYHRALVHFLESDLLNRSVKNYRMKVQADIDAKNQKKSASISRQTEVKSKKVIKTTKEFDPVKFAAELLRMGITNLNLGKKQ